MSDSWISAETEPKENDFRGIVSMHIRICGSILSRFGGPPYLYVDLHAGPGNLEFHGRQFPGSPLIFLDEAQRQRVRFESMHFEKDPDTAARLVAAIADVNGHNPAPVHAEPFEVGMLRWLAQAGPQRRRHGLIYSDPIRDELPHGILARAARNLPKVDFLTYVSATQYKRRRGVDDSRPYLSDHIAAVGKKYTLIREPHSAWQWTFLLFTNWADFPEWHKRGFHRADSARGARILDRLNLTSREHLEATTSSLFDAEDEPPYHSYREYLRHPQFLVVRAQVFVRANGVCERCGKRPPTEPHHLRYPPWGTFDVPDNMVAVCHPCHCEIHGKAS